MAVAGVLRHGVDGDGVPVAPGLGEDDEGTRRDAGKSWVWSAPAFVGGGAVELRPEEVAPASLGALLLCCTQKKGERA